MQLQLGHTILQTPCLVYTLPSSRLKHITCAAVSTARHAALCLSPFKRLRYSDEMAWSLSVEQHRRAELEAQMKAREVAKKKERADQLQEDLKVHRESAMYDPGGMGGGGAPHRSPAGQPISDLHQVGSILMLCAMQRSTSWFQQTAPKRGKSCCIFECAVSIIKNMMIAFVSGTSS